MIPPWHDGRSEPADVSMLRLDDINVLTTERAWNMDTGLVAGQVVKASGRLVHGDVAQAAQALRRVWSPMSIVWS
ncbi:hypothetical protein [Nonomuraea sp. NPDC049480]|uniref:hypothetical protein n=1 Tax=Nonomuraea sp. NPDC049480 TaxID=3364353 RepID=UPI0037A4E50E